MLSTGTVFRLSLVLLTVVCCYCSSMTCAEVAASQLLFIEDDDDYDDDRTATTTTTIRFFIVRHGETEANRIKMAAGQMESPLSELGVKQASSLYDALQNQVFHRYIMSDMERTQHTARLVMPSVTFSQESRLREMAKGAREGFPKSLSYQEALQLWQQSNSNDKQVPLLESDDDVRRRVVNWLLEVLRHEVADSQRQSPKSILVVTHAGVIRTLCAQLVPNQMPESVDISDMGPDGSTQRHLEVPNTSVTVIDFVLPDNEVDPKKITDIQAVQDLFEVKLRLLTWHKHLERV